MAKPPPFSFAQLAQALQGGFLPIGKGPLGQRAATETALQYGPALEALMRLGQQSTQELHSNVKGITRSGLAASQGIGQVAKDYVGLVGNGGTVPGATPPPSAEAAQRLGLSRDAVSGILAQMQGQQIAGVTSGTARARQQYQQGKQDIVSQMLSEGHKAALYNTGQYAGYVGDAKKSKEAIRQFNAGNAARYATAGLDPTTGQPIPGIFDRLHPKPKPAAPHAPVDGVDYATYMAMTPAERLAAHKAYATSGRAPTKPKPVKPTLPGGVPFNTQQQHNSFRNAVLRAQHFVDLLKPAFPGDRHGLAMVLLTGGKSGNLKIPSFDQDAVTVALDLGLLGGVTRGTARTLHSLGYGVHKLRFPSYQPGSDAGGSIGSRL